MIPVKPALEPSSFNDEVRIPGLAFLSRLQIPKVVPTGFKIPWKEQKAEYWKKCSSELENAYNHICCYVGMRINNSLKDPKHRSVEHFVPKSKDPWLAYEWSNYRLACVKANNTRQSKDVIDPFLVGPDDFRLDLYSGELFPNTDLPQEKQKLIQETIDKIELNDSYWTKSRQLYYIYYLEKSKTISITKAKEYLKENAPIVLAELERNIPPLLIEED